MIHPEAKRQLVERNPEDRLSLLLQWERVPEVAGIEPTTPKRERIQRFGAACRALKQPLETALANEADVQIQDIEGSSQAIVTTSVRRWRELVREDGILGNTDEATVLPDVRFSAL